MKKMKIRYLFASLIAISAFAGCSDDDDNGKNAGADIACSPTEINAASGDTIVALHVTCSSEWMIYSNDNWIKASQTYSGQAEGNATVTVAANSQTAPRKGNVVIKSGSKRLAVPVMQAAKVAVPAPDITAPEGYKLVWNDEFNENDAPDADVWYYETGGDGWGNNELQYYVPGSYGGRQLAEVKDGILNIVCDNVGGQVCSIRMNTRESWTYGYFEARLKLPSGKGTWPAFWMMPQNFKTWPDDGEIDIMEEVGYNANYVSSSVHCKSYNHTTGTQKTKEKLIPTAQTEFHVYALEWTEDFIRTLVDGEELFRFDNEKNGKDTWPFDAPFYLKLNLAWGGNWGGAQGVDESVLPAVYGIDYVRVFQKK